MEEEEEKKGDAEPPAIECCICAEELKDRKAEIECGHFFCVACITKWAEIENTCPYCKQEFTKIAVKKIGKNTHHEGSKETHQGKYKRKLKMSAAGLLRTSTNNSRHSNSENQRLLRSHTRNRGHQPNGEESAIQESEASNVPNSLKEADRSEIIKVIEV